MSRRACFNFQSASLIAGIKHSGFWTKSLANMEHLDRKKASRHFNIQNAPRKPNSLIIHLKCSHFARFKDWTLHAVVSKIEEYY